MVRTPPKNLAAPPSLQDVFDSFPYLGKYLKLEMYGTPQQAICLKELRIRDLDKCENAKI